MLVKRYFVFRVELCSSPLVAFAFGRLLSNGADDRENQGTSRELRGFYQVVLCRHFTPLARSNLLHSFPMSGSELHCNVLHIEHYITFYDRFSLPSLC